MSNKMKKIIGIALALAILISVIAGTAVYLLDYYPAEDYVSGALENTDYASIVTYGDDIIAFEPTGDTVAGLIFYPGGKVDYTAYAPLMQLLADKGILCLLVIMPCNLAVFDKNAASGLTMRYPSITHWYIGGHSLGGAMAASYISAHTDEYEGLILFGAYSASDISKTSLDVISVYGSLDGVLDMKKYEKYKSNLPSDYSEYVIEGGNHSYFGAYGVQSGDNNADIDANTQISIASAFIGQHIAERFGITESDETDEADEIDIDSDSEVFEG